MVRQAHACRTQTCGHLWVPVGNPRCPRVLVLVLQPSLYMLEKRQQELVQPQPRIMSTDETTTSIVLTILSYCVHLKLDLRWCLT
jgi:hypothetical protein